MPPEFFRGCTKGVIIENRQMLAFRTIIYYNIWAWATNHSLPRNYGLILPQGWWAEQNWIYTTYGTIMIRTNYLYYLRMLPHKLLSSSCQLVFERISIYMHVFFLCISLCKNRPPLLTHLSLRIIIASDTDTTKQACLANWFYEKKISRDFSLYFLL